MGNEIMNQFKFVRFPPPSATYSYTINDDAMPDHSKVNEKIKAFLENGYNANEDYGKEDAKKELIEHVEQEVKSMLDIKETENTVSTNINFKSSQSVAKGEEPEFTSFDKS